MVEGAAVLWHHRSLEAEISVGEPLRAHERYYVIGAPMGWLSVRVESGIGPVPEPPDISLWSAEQSFAVVDLATGRGIAVDHQHHTD